MSKDAHVDPFEPREIRRLVARYGSPLLIIDCERVRAQYRRLQKALPGEVQLVSRLGIDAARCIHTHPIKRDKDIRNALAAGVTIFVADNPDEVRKFRRYRDSAELMLRERELVVEGVPARDPE